MKNVSLATLRKAVIAAMLIFSTPALNAQSFAIDKVRSDFKALLQRPLVDPQPSLQTFTTDSVLIEKGFFYSEATEKVPLLFDCHLPMRSSLQFLNRVAILQTRLHFSTDRVQWHDDTFPMLLCPSGRG